ncbi:MAG: adenylate/guanylate cyclase domain-containing protein [Rhodobiaceae bacterium]|nr:adenylate/guanylate cyclase domain-containing protein [Rhodobiaceae bacterium]
MLGKIFRALFKRSQLVRLVGLVLLGAMLALRIWDPVPVEVLRLKGFDLLQRLAPNDNPNRPVMIVDIDEAALARHGQWPWPRTVVAALIDRIAGAGAAAIGIDIIFAEEDRTSPKNFASFARGLDPETVARLEALPSNDEVLAEAFRRARMVVVGQSGYHRDLERKTVEVKGPPLATIGGDPRPYMLKYRDLLHNVPVLQEAAASKAVLTVNPDVDGITRRVPLAVVARGEVFPTLSVELLRVVGGSRPLLIRTDEAGISSVGVSGINIPTDANGRLWVRFSKSDPARYVSAADVLAGDAQALARLGKRVVLIGTSALGLYDIKATPLDPVMPGVEIHAQLIENIFTREHIFRPNYTLAAELLAALLVGLFIIVAVPLMPAVATLLSGTAINCAILFGTYYLFTTDSLLLDATFPLITSVVVFASLVFFNYIQEESRRREIRSAFSQYLSPDVVEQLARDPSKLILGGETKEMTILFSDVRGFTSISEAYKAYPQELTHLINRLLTPLSRVVVDNGGTIDKYMGDNIMAFWNAPLEHADHAKMALSAALGMIDAQNALNEQLKTETAPDGSPAKPLAIGVGLNTGVNVVGNMGSDLRFDYTVLGDNVNLASRLEGQTKGYGVAILFGARTAELAGDDFAIIEVDLVAVKGKAEPERVFTVVGKKDVADDAEFQSLREDCAAMLAHYRTQDWSGAEKTIKSARKHAGRFGVSDLLDIYATRIAVFREAPPPKNWDGVFVATSK